MALTGKQIFEYDETRVAPWKVDDVDSYSYWDIGATQQSKRRSEITIR